MKPFQHLSWGSLAGALVLAAAVAWPQAAFAYVGPGAGLTVIGSAIALIGGVLLAIVGFVWYPIKRLMRRKNDAADEADEEGTPEA